MVARFCESNQTIKNGGEKASKRAKIDCEVSARNVVQEKSQDDTDINHKDCNDKESRCSSIDLALLSIKEKLPIPDMIGKRPLSLFCNRVVAEHDLTQKLTTDEKVEVAKRLFAFLSRSDEEKEAPSSQEKPERPSTEEPIKNFSRSEVQDRTKTNGQENHIGQTALAVLSRIDRMRTNGKNNNSR
jgi:hypothetical protein